MYLYNLFAIYSTRISVKKDKGKKKKKKPRHYLMLCFLLILNYVYAIHTINWRTFKFQNFFLQWASLFHPSRKNSVIVENPKRVCIHSTQWSTCATTFSQLYRFQGDIFGQSIWDKVMCYWEHVMENILKKLGEQEESNCALDLCFPSSICTERKWKG
jgi:hypothetical protein